MKERTDEERWIGTFKKEAQQKLAAINQAKDIDKRTLRIQEMAQFLVLELLTNPNRPVRLSYHELERTLGFMTDEINAGIFEACTLQLARKVLETGTRSQTQSSG